jgi:hypothetical protein
MQFANSPVTAAAKANVLNILDPDFILNSMNLSLSNSAKV